jgi:hypothetical protein
MQIINFLQKNWVIVTAIAAVIAILIILKTIYKRGLTQGKKDAPQVDIPVGLGEVDETKIKPMTAAIEEDVKGVDFRFNNEEYAKFAHFTDAELLELYNYWNLEKYPELGFTIYKALKKLLIRTGLFGSILSPEIRKTKDTVKLTIQRYEGFGIKE